MSCFDRYCLYSWLRIVNIIVNMFGAGMIVYCLWLLKEWSRGAAELPSPYCLPRPWFIYVCLGGGMVVCLITLSGHMVANCLTTPALSIYIVSIFSLVLIQAGIIVTILFRIDWEEQIMRCIDDYHDKFKSFIIFHLVMCRLIAIAVLVAEINIVVLASILWALGVDSSIYTHINSVPVNTRYSFLLDPDSDPRLIEGTRSVEETLKSYMQGIYTRSSYLISTYRN